MKTLRIWQWAMALMLVLPISTASAAFPDKPVRIIVPQTPGGSNDILARIIAERLSLRWGQPVVVENRGGAGGNIGVDFVAHRPADGYTLLLASDGPMAINPALYSKLSFDVSKDFVPIASLASFSFAFVVRKDLDAATFPAFVKLARENTLTLANAGNGSTNHLAGEIIKKAAGIKLTNVPYRGAPEALNDVMGGRVDAFVITTAAAAPQVASGNVRALMTTSRDRSPLLPAVPTLSESGVPLKEIRAWFGLFAPTGIPAATVEFIHAQVAAELRDPVTREKIAAQGMEVFDTTLPEFEAVWKAALTDWATVIKDAGVKVE